MADECPNGQCYQRAKDTHDVVFGKNGNSGLVKAISKKISWYALSGVLTAILVIITLFWNGYRLSAAEDKKERKDNQQIATTNKETIRELNTHLQYIRDALAKQDKQNEAIERLLLIMNKKLIDDNLHE